MRPRNSTTIKASSVSTTDPTGRPVMVAPEGNAGCNTATPRRIKTAAASRNRSATSEPTAPLTVTGSRREIDQARANLPDPHRQQVVRRKPDIHCRKTIGELAFSV